MANSSNWAKQLKHEGNSVISHLADLAENKEANDHIHQIRVHIKKLNAILSLIGNEQLTSVILREGFKKVFSICGEIRNNQIILDQILKLSPANTKMVQYLRQKILMGTKMLVSVRNALILKLELAIKLGLPYLKTVPDKIIESSYQITLAELLLLLHYQEKTRDLHDARKLIKNLIYPAAFLNKNLSRKFKPLHDTLGVLQEQIGTWHDLYITLDYCKKITGQKKVITSLDDLEKKSRTQVLTGIRKFIATYVVPK